MYEELRKTLLRELLSNQIQKLPENFYQRIEKYLDSNTGSVDSENKVLGKLLEREKHVLLDMLASLKRVRREKLLRQALVGRGLEALNTLLEEEREGGLELVDMISRWLERSPQGRRVKSPSPKHRADTILLRITKTLPQIVGADLRVYGPLHQEDLVTLPRENAEALVQKGAATTVKGEQS
ncbi:MAG: hypothetical protein DRO11_01055 [Methanobacteriota archaeon]|nr:MAG: hypothetical protein DRO11_01055 [Euryarchaeota archaeon]